MKVFTRDYRINHIYSPVFGEYYSAMKPCVLDIESTGLDRSRNRVILVGLLTETESGVRVTQFLAENHYEEYKVLQATLDFLKDEGIDYLITFNGINFDIPFLNARLENSFMDGHLSMYNFDLYRFFRKCTVLPDKLSSLSQTSCEAYFGIASDRKDTISGRENISLFNEYSLTGNSTVEKIILTHNREDVYQLYRLMKLAFSEEHADILSADFHSVIAKYGFPAASGRLSVRPVLKRSSGILKITGDQLRDAFSAAFFPDIDSPVTAQFNKTSSSYEITLPVSSHDDIWFADITKPGISIADDPDLVNGYLILNSRTINLLARRLVSLYL